MFISGAFCVPGPAQTADPEQIYTAAGALASKPTATISYGTSELQVSDLRLPAGKGPFPVAVVVHGGCWMASVDKRQGIAAFADALTARGFATWNIEYRRVGDAGGGFPGSFQDVAAARPAEYRIATPQDHLPFGVRQLLVKGELGDLMEPHVAAAKASGDVVMTLAPAGANHFDVVTAAFANGRAMVDFIADNALPQ